MVQCNLETVGKKRCDSDRRKVLNNLPSGLDETYKRILDQLNETNDAHDDLEFALRILTWLLYCNRCMKLSLLATAASIDPKHRFHEDQRLDEESIFDICRSLIHINKETGIIEFSHISVAQFLQSPTMSNREANRYYLDEATGHAILMKSCLMYLSSPGFSTIVSQLLKPQILTQLRSKFRDRFTFYAIYEWPKHAKKVESDITLPVVEFLTSGSFPSWRELWELSELREYPWWESENGDDQEEKLWSDRMECELVSAYRTTPGNPLYYAALLDLKSVVDELLLRKHDANEFGGPNSFPLFAALECHNLGVAESLLMHGGNVNIQDQCREDTAMHRAVTKDDKVVVKFLLDQDASLTICNLYGQAPLHSAVKTFCRQRKDADPEVVTMLAVKNANVTNKRGKTVVHIAADIGCVSSVSMMMQRGVDINITDNDGRTALHTVAQLGRMEMVDVLLNNQPNLQIADLVGYTPLHVAVQFGHAKIVAKLLQAMGDSLPPSDNLDTFDQAV